MKYQFHPFISIYFNVCLNKLDSVCLKHSKFILVQVAKALNLVESRTGRKFGDSTNPLLVSVRSGARASMPGHWLNEHLGKRFSFVLSISSWMKLQRNRTWKWILQDSSCFSSLSLDFILQYCIGSFEGNR